MKPSKLMYLIIVVVMACGERNETKIPTGSNSPLDQSTEATEESTEEPVTDTGEPAEETGEAEADLVNGQLIHDNMCMSCHVNNTDMQEHVPNMEDFQLREVIQNGVGPMPAQDVAGQDLIDLIAFLRQEYP